MGDQQLEFWGFCLRRRNEHRWHGKLAQKELGAVIPIQDDGRLMSRGEAIAPVDAVVFVEAPRETTKLVEWSIKSKPSALLPHAPARLSHGVTPRETVA